MPDAQDSRTAWFSIEAELLAIQRLCGIYLISPWCAFRRAPLRACLPAACLLPPTLIRASACPVHVHRCSLITCTTLSGRLEIEHGRAAMLGFIHVIALKAGIVMPGYLSTSQDHKLKFSDVLVGCFASLEAAALRRWASPAAS